MRSLVALAASLVIAQAAAGPGPSRPLSGDAIDQSRELSTRPPATLAPAPPPAERYVPERGVREPGTGREVTVPGHWERRLSDQQVTVPPLPAHGPDGDIRHLPGGERPPADIRPGP